jgi:hypothetical protein
MLSKLGELVSNPSEIIDRLSIMVEGRLQRSRRVFYEVLDVDAVAVGSKLGLESFLCDERVQQLEMALPTFRSPYRHEHSADRGLARFCYAACRALRPKSVLETGVAHGMTSAYILTALEANGSGLLHSIDLPPLGGGLTDVGRLIETSLRTRWRLHRGSTRRLVPALARAIAPIGMFVHDSLHTYRTMSSECKAVMPRLARPGITIWDDIDANDFFKDFCATHRPEYCAAVASQTKPSPFGVAVFL